MFRDIIRQTPFSGETADKIFPNITGENYNGDVTFVSTLRALLAPKMQPDDRVFLRFRTFTVGSVEADMRPDELADDMISRYYDPGTIEILNFRGSRGDSAPVQTVLQKLQHLPEYRPGFHRMERIGAFYESKTAGKFRVDCYVSDENRTAILLVENLDTPRLHFLQASILAFLPWYLDREKGITPEEKALITALGGNDQSAYLTALRVFADAYDFRSMEIRSKLSGIKHRYEEAEIERATGKIQEINRQMMEYQNTIGRLRADRNDMEIRLLGLREKLMKDTGEDSELMEYFLCNKALTIYDVSDTRIQFLVTGYLSWWDHDSAERHIGNRGSYVYGVGGHHGSEACDNMQLLLREMFVPENPRIRLRLCAGYQIDLRRNVETVSLPYDDLCTGYLPNPHIENYSCLGNYIQILNECMDAGDYVMAIEQCVASAGSLNWNDSTVMENFMKTMWRDRVSCIELPDGRVVKPSKAVEWIKANVEA